MILISTIINKFKHGFLEQYKDLILPSHQKALWAMEQCRQKDGPYMLVQCTDHDCGERRYIPHSCGHRNCLHCQNHENQQWIENQQDKQLPAGYYLVTFTLPKQLRALAWRHQKIVYSLMFYCVQETLKTFTLNDKKFGGTAGFTAILHTHSRELNHHPHILPATHTCAQKTAFFASNSLYNLMNLFQRSIFRKKNRSCPTSV